MSNKPKRCVMQFIIHPSPTIFGWYYTSHSVNHQLLLLMVWYASFNSHLLVWRQIITSTSTWYIHDLNIDNAYFKSFMYTRIELFTKLKDIKYHVINAHVRKKNGTQKKKYWISFWLVHNVPNDLFYKNKKSCSCIFLFSNH